MVKNGLYYEFTLIFSKTTREDIYEPPKFGHTSYLSGPKETLKFWK